MTHTPLTQQRRMSITDSVRTVQMSQNTNETTVIVNRITKTMWHLSHAMFILLWPMAKEGLTDF